MPAAARPWQERFWAKVQKSENGCWFWTGHIARNGYGRFRKDSNGPSRAAHCIAYEELVGPIPDGMDLDHVKARGCGHRHCVNPAHLEPVTRSVNLRRGDTGKKRKEVCKRGHALTGANVYVVTRDGSERHYCRTCQRERNRAWMERNSA